MKFSSRMRRAVTIGSAVTMGLGLTASLTASSRPKPHPTPNHAVQCSYTPDVPYQYGGGAPVHGDAHITCNAATDVSATSVRVWRYDPNQNAYYIVAENSSGQTGTDFYVSATGNCSAQVPYIMHTEVYNEAFHGGWDTTDNNSADVTLAC